MASSRLEKIGNIFTRVQGLLKSGAMNYEDRPLFYEIYQSFKPLKERKYNEPAPAGIKIRPIFYSEDTERAARDDSNTLFNLNESSTRRSESTLYQKPVEPTDKKIFNFKQLSDLKE